MARKNKSRKNPARPAPRKPAPDAAAVVYMRLQSSDTWHWVPACSSYPKVTEDMTHNVISTVGRPKYGEFCNQCGAKERNAKAKTA